MPTLRLVAENYEDPEGPKFEGTFARQSPQFKGTLEVVSYNIDFGLRIDQAIHEIRSRSDLKEADIMLLQEMDESGTERIARALECNYVYYPSSIHNQHGRNFGNAILSRWPLSDARKVILPNKSRVNQQIRIAVSANVQVQDYNVLTYCVHTEVYTASIMHRAGQVAAIARDVEAAIAAGQMHVIVGGDFNTVTNRSIQRVITQFEAIGMKRASKGIGPTIAKYGLKPSAADHIFTCGLTVVSRGKFAEADASDHFPIWVRLAPEPPAT